MSTNDPRLPLLNIFEVQDDNGEIRHLICFVDPVLGGAVGLREECVVGEFEPASDGGFDPETFRPNPEFLLSLQRYLNEEVLPSIALGEPARSGGRGEQVILDPRFDPDTSEQPTIEDVLGVFSVEPSGAVVPNSFRLNGGHVLFDPERGLSGLFYDRHFYNWLHPEIHSPRHTHDLDDPEEI